MNASNDSGFDRIIGHERVKAVLAGSVMLGNPAQTIIFAGMQSVGKLALALEFAKALSCENPGQGNACGVCSFCRAIDHGNYPDIIVFPVDKAQVTSIESMKKLRDLVVYSPTRGKWKINIIERADTLSSDATNCLLKLLEEPPEYLINILLYRNEASALSTVKSRSRMFRLFQVPADILTSRLMDDYGVDADQAQFLAAYSQGRPGLAISLLGDTQFQKERDSIARIASEIVSVGVDCYLRLAQSLRPGTAASVDGEDQDTDTPDVSEKNTKKKVRTNARDTVMFNLDTLLIWYRDLLAAKLQGTDAALVNIDCKPEILRQAGLYRDTELVQSIIQKVLLTRRRVQANGNPQIQTEALLADIALLAQR